MTAQKYYDLLDNAPTELEPIARLFRWSENCNYPTPATLYLDLTGWSEDELGERLCGDKLPALGYLELYYLGEALSCYSDRPQEAADYVRSVIYADQEEETEAN